VAPLPVTIARVGGDEDMCGLQRYHCGRRVGDGDLQRLAHFARHGGRKGLGWCRKSNGDSGTLKRNVQKGGPVVEDGQSPGHTVVEFERQERYLKRAYFFSATALREHRSAVSTKSEFGAIAS
jgi:hypothetical protein